MCRPRCAAPVTEALPIVVCAGRISGRCAAHRYAGASGAERRRMGCTLQRGGGEGRRTGRAECRPRGSDCEPDVAALGVHRRTAAFASRGLHGRGARRAPAEHGRATRGRCGPCATVVHGAGDVAHRMPCTAAPSGMHASPMSTCNGNERRTRTYDARHSAAGNKHRPRSHGPTANATTAASLPPFDLPHDGIALAPPSTSVTRAKRCGGVLLDADMLPPDASMQRRLLQAAGARPRARFRLPLCELCSACAARRPVYYPGV